MITVITLARGLEAGFRAGKARERTGPGRERSLEPDLLVGLSDALSIFITLCTIYSGRLAP